MPVDKAWEEYRESDDWVRDDDEKPYREGYFEGQKSLSPEVRSFIGRAIVKVICCSEDDCGISFYYCNDCGEEHRNPEDIKHKEYCLMSMAEKLLAKE
jgi:hypothetical protein